MIRVELDEAEIAALGRIAAELANWNYPTPARSPNDLLRPWSMTHFERDTVVKVLHEIIEGQDAARVEDATSNIKATSQQHMALAYINAARAGAK